MALTHEEIEELRGALDTSARPLIIFDGDNDGLASFMNLYQYVGDGKGVMISGRPIVDEQYLRKVEEYSPDSVFIVDLAQVSQEFIDGLKMPVYWLDHHDPHHSVKLPKHIHYYNPRVHDNSDGSPASYWSYMVTKKNLWFAMTGIIGDYAWELIHEFRESYPDLLPVDITNQGQAMFDARIGLLTRIISFNLKGAVSSSMTSVKILSRIESPYEILDQSSTKGKYVYKKYERVNKSYQEHLLRAQGIVSQGRVAIYEYENETYSFSGDLSNELKWRNPDKVIVVARRHDERVVMSVRSENVEVLGNLQEALEGLDGYGGGHPKACGAVVSKNDFDEFKKRFSVLF